ncbi:hypothetical protein ACSBR1_006453 [Camellia fascicularis]
MGSLCSCFCVPDAEENVESNSSNHGNSISPDGFIQNLRNKCGALFGKVETHAPLSIQAAASSSSVVAPINTQLDTSTHLPNHVNPQNSQLQRHGKGTSRSHLERELHRRSNVQIRVDKQDGSYYEEESKGWHSKSSGKVLTEKVESGVEYFYPPAEEDEDVCPTCLEEYTTENPKIITHCHHQYHLSCIYEWMERSDKCPICGKLMEFNETS